MMGRPLTYLGADLGVLEGVGDQDLGPLGVRRGAREANRTAVFGWTSLTPSELRIAALVRDGLTNREIGYELHMSKYTVAQHIKEMFKRTGSVNRTDLINRAHITGILNGHDDIRPTEG